MSTTIKIRCGSKRSVSTASGSNSKNVTPSSAPAAKLIIPFKKLSLFCFLNKSKIPSRDIRLTTKLAKIIFNNMFR